MSLIFDTSAIERLQVTGIKKFRIEIGANEEFSIFQISDDEFPDITDAIVEICDIIIYIDFVSYTMLAEAIVKFDTTLDTFIVDSQYVS
ncbi:MAG: hypothetical protein QXN55_01020 [Candidatus Nitrosotenuis sp.]